MGKIFSLAALAILFTACTNEISETDFGTYRIISQSRGAELGYSPNSGIQILNVDGFAFKDLNKNGECIEKS